MYVKGWAAPETRAAEERAGLLIEQADALGEPPEDPLLLFTVLYGVAVANFGAFNGDVCRDLAAHFLELAEKQADEKNAALWRIWGTLHKGSLFALTGDYPGAVQMITSGVTALRPTGATLWMPLHLAHLAIAHAELDELEGARRYIEEAIIAVETTGERWCEAEVHRIAGEIALRSPELDAANAEAYFERALTVARQQQAKSWELRAAMSLARLWRDQGKLQQARELLAPVYGWFTEGFDTRDLKEAKALLEELASKGVRSSACDSVNQRQQ